MCLDEELVRFGVLSSGAPSTPLPDRIISKLYGTASKALLDGYLDPLRPPRMSTLYRYDITYDIASLGLEAISMAGV